MEFEPGRADQVIGWYDRRGLVEASFRIEFCSICPVVGRGRHSEADTESRHRPLLQVTGAQLHRLFDPDERS